MKHTDWPAYYEVTAERQPRTTVIRAAEAFDEADDVQTALGEPHHFHDIEVVAVRSP